MSYHDAFARLCKESGVSQNVALRALGLSPSASQYWKNGNPNDTTVRAIARLFDVTVKQVRDYAAEEYAYDKNVIQKDDKLQELIDLYRISPPSLRRAAIAVLKSGIIDK